MESGKLDEMLEAMRLLQERVKALNYDPFGDGRLREEGGGTISTSISVAV